MGISWLNIELDNFHWFFAAFQSRIMTEEDMLSIKADKERCHLIASRFDDEPGAVTIPLPRKYGSSPGELKH